LDHERLKKESLENVWLGRKRERKKRERERSHQWQSEGAVSKRK